jgi:hypothetical protein
MKTTLLPLYFVLFLFVIAQTFTACEKPEGFIQLDDTVGYYSGKIVFAENNNFYLTDPHGKSIVQSSFDSHQKNQICINSIRTQIAFLDIDSSAYINNLANDNYINFSNKGKFTSIDWGTNSILYGIQNNQIKPINSTLNQIPAYNIPPNALLLDFALGIQNNLALLISINGENKIYYYKAENTNPYNVISVDESVNNIKLSWLRNVIAFNKPQGIKLWYADSSGFDSLYNARFTDFAISEKANDLIFNNLNSNKLSIIDLTFAYKFNRDITTQFSAQQISGINWK